MSGLVLVPAPEDPGIPARMRQPTKDAYRQWLAQANERNEPPPGVTALSDRKACVCLKDVHEGQMHISLDVFNHAYPRLKPEEWSADGRVEGKEGARLDHSAFDESACFQACLQNHFEIVSGTHHVINCRLNSGATILIVLKPYEWFVCETQKLNCAQRARKSETNHRFNDVQSIESALRFLQSQIFHYFQNFPTLLLIHLKVEIADDVGLHQPAINRRKDIQNFRVEIGENEATFAYTGFILNLVSCGGYSVSLATQPVHGGCRSGGNHNPTPGNRNREQRDEHSPSGPIYRAPKAHRPTLVESKPPIHCPLPFLLTGILPRDCSTRSLSVADQLLAAAMVHVFALAGFLAGIATLRTISRTCRAARAGLRWCWQKAVT